MTDNEKLPKGWVLAPLGELAEYINGRAFKPTEWEREGKPILRIQNLTGSTDEINRYSKPIEDKYLIKDGQLLISWSATLGAFIYRGEDAVLNQHIFKVIPYVDKKYLYHLTNAYIGSLKSKVHGSGMQHITKGLFDTSQVPLAPSNEQLRIVSKIEELVSELDAGVSSLHKAKCQIKIYRQSVLKSAFDGKLTAKWREKNKNKIESVEKILARIKEERKLRLGKRHKDVLPFDASELPKLPKEWVWCSMSEACGVISNGNTPEPSKMTRDSGDIPFIKVYNLTKDGRLDFTVKPTFIDRETHRKELAKSITYPGDILINIVGPPLGKVSLVPDTYPEWNTNQAVVLYRASKNLETRFLLFYLLSNDLIRFLTKKSKATAGQYNVQLSTCRSAPLPFVPILEQKEIVRQIDIKMSAIERTEQLIDKNLTMAENMRQSILKTAFEGKLAPQDPKDEPAEKLLERIRAEKSKKR